MKPRLAIIKWSDAHFINDEASAEDVHKNHKPSTFWSAGILVKSNEAGVTLAMDYGLPLDESENGISYRTRSFIPRSLIEVEIDAGPLMKLEKRKPPPPKPEPLQQPSSPLEAHKGDP